MRSRTIWVIALALGLIGPVAAQELNKRNYRGYLSYILPKPGERRWQRVRWQPTFWDGVIEAHRQRRPILLWTMNGHPLACT